MDKATRNAQKAATDPGYPGAVPTHERTHETDQIWTDDGYVWVKLPRTLSAENVGEIEELFRLIVRRLRRRLVKRAPAEEAAGTGAAQLATEAT